MLIKPKEVAIKDVDGVEKIFVISRLPATVGREILAKYPLSNAPKIGDYEVSKEAMLKNDGKIANMFGGGLTISHIASFIQSAAEDINLLSQSADALNLPVEVVDAFGKVVTSMGGDAQGARDTLMDMSNSIRVALQDTSSGKAEVFNSLKISLKDMQGDSIDAMEGVYRLSDAVQGLSKKEAILRIKEVGITDNKIIESILKGRTELEALTKKQKENGVVTKELVLQAQKYKQVTGGLKRYLIV
ncbi:hypothetical protein GQR86_07550 [Providencia vermicola]|nr:hypothetical protein [Providencia vermicola]